jgi:hypothetical protein
MNTLSPSLPQKKADFSSSSRLLVLQGLVPIATNLVSSQLEDFTARLCDALFKLSEQTIHPEEAASGFQAFQLLSRNTTTFYRLVAGQINASLSKEVSTIHLKKKPKKETEKQDFSLVSFEEMESRVLIRNLSQILEVNHADLLMGLNIRIGNVLQRTPINVAQNPFRPEVFILALYQAWTEFDSASESHQLVLRLLQPNLFLRLAPILSGLNDAMIERGILPDLSDVYQSKHQSKSARQHGLRGDDTLNSDPYLHNKLRSLFFGAAQAEASQNAGAVVRPNSATQGVANGQGGALNFNGTFAGAEGGAVGQSDKVLVDREFFNYLSVLQQEVRRSELVSQPQMMNTSAPLRQLAQQAPVDQLSQVDQSTIELLARIFDFVFNDPSIPEEIKKLIGQLQIPTLKVALMDKDFFFKESHPARVLIDTLARSGAQLDTVANNDDPLYQMIEGIVEKVQDEFDEQIDLFSDVVADLEAFLQEEEEKADAAISDSVAKALKQEKLRVAKEFAEHDVAIRVETGEVAGFLETFLQEQWLRILTIGHNVKEEKPHALENALKTMDDLIWSLKPKNSAEERKELVSKLPSMLSLLNAWLNAIKWEEPERVVFFSKLAERHAAIARAPLEFSPRRQLEIAVNIAQRASERRLDRHVQTRSEQTDDEWEQQANEFERGIWLNFVQPDESMARYKLAWVSPKRSRFIFTNRQGQDALSLSGEELVSKLRDGLVLLIQAESVVDRALLEALRDPPQ